MNALLEARLVTTVRMTPEAYLKARQEDPRSLLGASIIPPSLDDDDDYGSLVIQIKEPRYEVEL